MARRCTIAMMFVGALSLALAFGQSNGNPRPGFPHDTIMIHVQDAASGPKACDGGHSLFVRHVDGVVPDTYLNITMTDWTQVDNDKDGRFDEDPLVDGIDEDGDGLDGEDGVEPGAKTMALDCDSWTDGELTLQIRDTDPRLGFVSTQEWWIRLVGKPEQNFGFTTHANQTVSCTIVDPGPDGLSNTSDDVVTCVSGEYADWVELSEFNLSDLGCVKRVKLSGKNGVSAGGRTPFCDITPGMMVNVDVDGDGVPDTEEPVFIFSVSCLDNPLTLDVNEALFCPLSTLIWEINSDTTSQATAQIFVSHTGSAPVTGGKIVK